jgi:hypothetical protein
VQAAHAWESAANGDRAGPRGSAEPSMSLRLSSALAPH